MTSGVSGALRPALSILQLDTHFPRIPGDVACPETYRAPVQIIRVPGACVSAVVRRDPARLDIGPFEAALTKAEGDVVATSCGFLSYWQKHLQERAARPVISSSLIALSRLARRYDPDELAILTFDQAALGAAYLGAYGSYARSIFGLPEGSALRRAIEGSTGFDADEVSCEICALAQSAQTSQSGRIRHLLFECTNFPPYTGAVRARTGLSVTHILSEIEAVCPGLVRPEFL